MRVLHWYPNLLGGGGVSNAVMGLAQAQARLGEDVVIAADGQHQGPHGRACVPQGLHVVLWNPSWMLGKGTRFVRGLRQSDRRILAEIRPDIVHLHGEFVPDNLRVPSLFDCPRVISPHGAFHPRVLEKARVLKLLYLALARRILYPKAVFHALSPLEKSSILNVVPRNDVYVAPNGPSPGLEEHLSPLPVRAGSAGKIMFLFAGRLDVYHKGLDLMLDAFCAACGEIPAIDMRLSFAGLDFGGGKAFLQRRARDLGMENKIEFLGNLGGSELSSAYLDSDIFVLLSRNDAFSVSAVEALFFRKPVILSANVGVGSYREIQSLPHVKIAPPDVQGIARTMAAAAQNLEALTRSARNAFPIVKEAFSWQRAAAISLEAYRSLVR